MLIILTLVPHIMSHLEPLLHSHNLFNNNPYKSHILIVNLNHLSHWYTHQITLCYLRNNLSSKSNLLKFPSVSILCSPEIKLENYLGLDSASPQMSLSVQLVLPMCYNAPAVITTPKSEPYFTTEALLDYDWKQVMKSKYDVLIANNTWSL